MHITTIFKSPLFHSHSEIPALTHKHTAPRRIQLGVDDQRRPRAKVLRRDSERHREIVRRRVVGRAVRPLDARRNQIGADEGGRVVPACGQSV